MRLRTWLNFWLVLPLLTLMLLPVMFHYLNILPKSNTALDIFSSFLLLGLEHCLLFFILICMPHTTKLSDTTLMRLSWLLPVVFAAFAIAMLRIFVHDDSEAHYNAILRIGFLCLLISYGFIIPLNLATFVLLKARILKKK